MAENSTRPEMNLKKIIFFSAIILILLVLPLVFDGPVALHQFIMILFFAFLAMSWNIVGGLAGQLSLGHAIFTMTGAYVSTIMLMTWGISPWIGMFAGGFVASMLSLVIGYPCFKLRGAYYALSTLAFAELARVMVNDTDTFLGLKVNAARGLIVPGMGQAPAYFQFLNKQYYYYIILGFCLTLLTVVYLINRSKFGYYLAAIRQDQETAESVGINVPRTKLTAAVISSFFTALGGVFYAQYVMYISAPSLGGMHLSLEMVFMTIVGGKGTLFGPVIGAALLTPLAEMTRTYLGGSLMGIHLLLYGLVLMIVVKFMPSGIIVPLSRVCKKLFS